MSLLLKTSYFFLILKFCCSITQSCMTLCNTTDCSTPGLPVLHELPELAQTHVHWVGDVIQPFRALLSLSPPTFKLSQHQSVLLIRWPKYRSFSFSISTSKEYSVLIPFRIDWFDHLAARGNFKSLLQHHSSKASIFQHSAFFMIQLLHPYMTNGKPELWLYGSFLAK